MNLTIKINGLNSVFFGKKNSKKSEKFEGKFEGKFEKIRKNYLFFFKRYYFENVISNHRTTRNL